jgi:hypothetical protein
MVKEKGERKMKTKLLALVVMTLLALSVFAVVPAFSFVPTERTVLYIDPEEKTLTGPCTESRTFEADVIIYNVKDLYAWELLIYYDSTYLNLTDWQVKVPPGWGPADYQILYNDYNIPPGGGTFKNLHIAVTRLGLVPGFNGTCSLVHLVFHVEYEPCWPEKITTYIDFWLPMTKLSNACGGAIVPDEIHNSTIKLVSSQPNVEVLFSDTFDLTKNETQGWINKQVITAYVWLSNVTKLWEVRVQIKWNTTLLALDYQQITINEEKFPQPWVKLDMTITPGASPSILDKLDFTIARPNETEKYLKGTFWLLKLDFKVNCVMNTTGTEYIPKTTTKTGVPIPVDTWIEPVDGYMKMGADTIYTPSAPMYNYTLSKSRYYFTPIPYDFDQSGHVGVEDITIILYNYGKPDTPFDFNKNGVVDIYDVVKVAKAYCTSTPPPIPKP